MHRKCFITSAGQFLPGEPVGNDAMEARLGQIGSKPSMLRSRVLQQNKIEQRYYAIDARQETVFTNAQMAAHAVRDALAQSTLDLKDIGMLVAATSQGDLPLPGFASMVQGDLKMPPCEVATLHGICASSVIGLRHAVLAVGAGEANAAVCVASEFASRLLKASRFQAQGYGDDKRLPFETEFLRWMLSDGAGALLLSDKPAERGVSLEVEKIVLKSYAGDFPPCMFVGNKAEEFLRNELASGPVPAAVMEDRSKEAGISASTLKRAKKKIGVASVKRGKPGEDGCWEWELPEHADVAKGTIEPPKGTTESTKGPKGVTFMDNRNMIPFDDFFNDLPLITAVSSPDEDEADSFADELEVANVR